MKHGSAEKYQSLLSNQLFSGMIDVVQESVDEEGERISVSYPALLFSISKQTDH